MALHPNFPESPYAILDPAIRWFPADEALWESSSEKLMPPLVPELRKQVKAWRDSGYAGATDTSKSLLNYWFNTPHLLPQAYLPSSFGSGAGGEGLAEFQYYFAQREGQEDLDVPLKMQRLRQWCEDINRVYLDVMYDFVYVDEEGFEKYKPASFRQLLDGFKEYK
ncbi:MAG: hypothetical protein WA140_05515 [Geobacteraceae bacterium]